MRTAPHHAATLYEPLPYDFRGEQREGGVPFYFVPTFTRHGDRLFIRYIRPFIEASQRHESAPRITDAQRDAMDAYDALINDADNRVEMALRPGEMQFVNNYHVLHARRRYTDDRDGRPCPLAEAAVAGHRRARSRRSPRALPAGRLDEPLGCQAHPRLSDVYVGA